MIYFAQSESGGHIKIGLSDAVGSRITALRYSLKIPDLVILATVEGDRGMEAEIHGRFKHLRVKGEWFDARPDLLEFIAHHGEPWDGSSSNHVRLELDDERHAIIRVMAAQAGMSMAAFVRAAIIKLVDEYQKRKGGK